MQTYQPVLDPIAKFFEDIMAEIGRITPEDIETYKPIESIGDGEVVLATLPEHLKKLFAMYERLYEIGIDKYAEFLLAKDGAEEKSKLDIEIHKSELVINLFWALVCQEYRDDIIEHLAENSLSIRVDYQLVTVQIIQKSQH